MGEENLTCDQYPYVAAAKKLSRAAVGPRGQWHNLGTKIGNPTESMKWKIGGGRRASVRDFDPDPLHGHSERATDLT